MSPESAAVNVVLSWVFGPLGLVALGVGFPALLSIIPDAIGFFRRRGDIRPTLVLVAASLGDAVVGVWMVSLAGAPGSPSTAFWALLSIALATASGTAGFLFAVSRAWGRRQRHRSSIQAADGSGPIGSGDWPAAPRARKRDLGWREAEYLAADWMRYLGAEGVEVTRERRDGGVDVVALGLAAQVKCWTRDSVGVDKIRQLQGVVAVSGHRGVFFSTTGYTSDAQEFAREADVALFIMRPEARGLVPIGPLAQSIWTYGLPVLQLQRPR